MTRDDVMALSGRELDIAVAEKVLGHRVIHFGDDPPYGWDHMFDGDAFVGELPEYSSDWEAMGALIERLEERGYIVLLHYHPETPECAPAGGRWAQVYLPGRARWALDVGWTRGATIPEAVAKAALLAVGEG